jgi:hypothetical protein
MHDGNRRSRDTHLKHVPRLRAFPGVRRRGLAWNLRFESVGAHIPTAAVAGSPALMFAAVEDLCWQIAMQDLRSRRPRRWRRAAYAAWSAQVRALTDNSARLRRMIELELIAW